jgi:hypothetical protein
VAWLFSAIRFESVFPEISDNPSSDSFAKPRTGSPVVERIDRGAVDSASAENADIAANAIKRIFRIPRDLIRGRVAARKGLPRGLIDDISVVVLAVAVIHIDFIRTETHFHTARDGFGLQGTDAVKPIKTGSHENASAE